MRLTLPILVGCLCLVSIWSPLPAQRNNPMLTIVNGNMYSGEAMNVFDLRDRQTIIENYWFDDWRNGGILLKDSQVVKGFPLRYNRFSRNIEIRTVWDVKVLPETKVSLVYMITNGDTSVFVNLTNYLGLPPNPAFTGLSRLLYDGRYTVFHRKEGEVLKANYVPALDAGYTNDRIVFTDAFYLYDGDRLELLPTRKKKLSRFLEVKGIQVEEFMQAARFNGKRPEDLIRLFEYVEAQAE